MINVLLLLGIVILNVFAMYFSLYFRSTKSEIAVYKKNHLTIIRDILIIHSLAITNHFLIDVLSTIYFFIFIHNFKSNEKLQLNKIDFWFLVLVHYTHVNMLFELFLDTNFNIRLF